MITNNIGQEIHDLAKRLWPINRSITGNGVRATLKILKELNPKLSIHEVPSGTKVFDWTVPPEWHVNDAYIITPSGKKICDFKNNNLYLLGYSTPIKKKINLKDLQKNLYSIPEQPNAIPYATSYYEERWGFCLPYNERVLLEDGDYEVFIDSKLFKGSLTYGEILIKGNSDKEIFLSTYVCHPSMANNELSGIVVASYIANWLLERKNNRFSYRFVFLPETIGSISYLSKNFQTLKSKVYAGFNISCVGDDRSYSYLPSRNGNTISDKVAKHVLKHIYPNYKSYRWKDRGSDERQYCSPGIDLPIASIMRTKYGEYEEYHTSLDDLKNVVTPNGLAGGYNAIKTAIETLENNKYPKVKVFCEPQLGKRSMYPNVSTKESYKEVSLMMNIISYSDGSKSLLDIAELCEVPIWKTYSILEKLIKNDLIDINEQSETL
jgi:aminopeptidase-like protein